LRGPGEEVGIPKKGAGWGGYTVESGRAASRRARYALRRNPRRPTTTTIIIIIFNMADDDDECKSA